MVAAAQGSRSTDPSQAERLLVQSGGLPLLVEALVQASDLEDAPTRPSGRSAPVPTVRATEQLIQTLDPSARRLLQALAVLAAPSGLIDLGQVADLPDPATALTAARSVSASTDMVRPDQLLSSLAFCVANSASVSTPACRSCPSCCSCAMSSSDDSGALSAGAGGGEGA